MSIMSRSLVVACLAVLTACGGAATTTPPATPPATTAAAPAPPKVATLRIDDGASLDATMASLRAQANADPALASCWFVWGRDLALPGAHRAQLASHDGAFDGWLVCGEDRAIYDGLRAATGARWIEAVAWLDGGLRLMHTPEDGSLPPGKFLIMDLDSIAFFHDGGTDGVALFASEDSDRAAPFGPMWSALRTLPSRVRVAAIKVPY
jgi:hypothetical protein